MQQKRTFEFGGLPVLTIFLTVFHAAVHSL